LFGCSAIARELGFVNECCVTLITHYHPIAPYQLQHHGAVFDCAPWSDHLHQVLNTHTHLVVTASEANPAASVGGGGGGADATTDDYSAVYDGDDGAGDDDD
jgi:hypothetical protein